MSRILIIGSFVSWNLDSSYRAAFTNLGHEVLVADVEALTRSYARLGRFGRKFHDFVPVDAWVTKANREIVVKAIESRIDMLVVVGSWSMQAGALAQIKAATGAQIVNIWPDTLVNLRDYTILALPVYDLVATYSQNSVAMFERLGARRVVWVPLAGDPSVHPAVDLTEQEKEVFGADVTFVGGWRPEREEVLTHLAKDGSFRLKIWGPAWDARCKNNQAILNVWQQRPLLGEEFAKATRASKINVTRLTRPIIRRPICVSSRFPSPAACKWPRLAQKWRANFVTANISFISLKARRFCSASSYCWQTTNFVLK